MAWASTETLLSLNRFQSVLGINPFHFHQMEVDTLMDDATIQQGCDPYWLQYDWMLRDRVSRESLARAIAQAERILANYLGFYPAPQWVTDEQARYPQTSRRWAGNGGHFSVRGLMYNHLAKPVPTRWSYVSAVGRERWDLLASDVAVTYSDPYSINIDSLGTVNTVLASPPTGLAGKEVAIVPAGTGTDDLRKFSIRNLKKTLSGGNQVTVEGPSAYFIDPDLLEANDLLDGSDSTNFIEYVDVYRHWTSDDGDDYAPAIFLFEEPGTYTAGIGSSVGLYTATGTLQIRNSVAGRVAPVPATWSGAAWQLACLRGEPDHVLLYYLSGYPSDDFGEMAPPLDRMVAALAVSLLGKPICGCGFPERIAQHWQEIPEAPTYHQQQCPFGPANGAYEAYLTAVQFANLDAVSIAGG